MHFEIQLAVAPGREQRLVHDADRSALRHAAEQRFDIFRVEPNAAVARAHADAIRLVRAVDQVTRNRQRHRKRAERVVGARRHDARKLVATLEVLLAHRSRHVPDRITRLLVTLASPNGVAQPSAPMPIG